MADNYNEYFGSSIFGSIERGWWGIYAEHSSIPTVTSSPYDAKMYKMYLFARQQASESARINNLGFDDFKENFFSNYLKAGSDK